MLSWESLHSISVGGLAAHVSELAVALTLMGHEVHVFTRMDAGQSRYDCIAGVHYHRCPFESDADFLHYIGRMCDVFVDRFKAAEEFYGRRFDIVHGHDWLCVQALQRIQRELGRSVVLTVHSTEYGRCGNEMRNGMSRRIRDIEWQGTDIARQVICVSTALADEVRRIYSVPSEKISVLYNGVDVRRFDAQVDPSTIRSHIGVETDAPLILFVGRLAVQKGPDLLLEAAPGLLRHFPAAKLVFVGDGDMRAALQASAASAGLFNSVRFLGYRNGGELVGLFRSADVVCVPSRNEPFGIVVLEGWSARKPVVVTRNGGPAEFVRDQENGLVVEADRESIGWGLGVVLSNADNADRIANNGRQEAETRFNWDIIAEGTQSVYEAA